MRPQQLELEDMSSLRGGNCGRSGATAKRSRPRQHELAARCRDAATPPFPEPKRHPFDVPPGDWARRGLVDRGFVERSVAAMREQPEAERELRQAMAETLDSIRDLDRFYGCEPNAWAAATRERLWMERFTAEAILRELTGQR